MVVSGLGNFLRTWISLQSTLVGLDFICLKWSYHSHSVNEWSGNVIRFLFVPLCPDINSRTEELKENFTMAFNFVFIS